ncbi:MAG TPA: hypothetical protein VNI57_13615 [Candidatus Saccharimonadales bacterium]|nr:hypothetical protein [Candidatus Saccharimonadales bacterium]
MPVTNETFRVPKVGVRASVHLAGGGKMEVVLYLSDRAPMHDGPEQISDLLTSDAGFLPVRDLGSDRVTLLRREAIMAVSVSGDYAGSEEREPGEIGAGTDTITEEVEAILAGGARLRGRIRYAMPEGQRRLQDYLNLPEPLVFLREDAELRILCKRWVASIGVQNVS